MLVDFQIAEEIAGGRLVISPWNPKMLQPASVDLTLDRFFRVYADHTEPVDPRSEERRTVQVELHEGERFELHSLRFALASTVERVRIPDNMIGRLEGKSSLARMGLFVHVTAGFFDPGFEGFCTLELFNASPFTILLYPNMPICQMGFDYSALWQSETREWQYVISPDAKNPYRGKYVNQAQGPQESLYYKNFDGEG